MSNDDVVVEQTDGALVFREKGKPDRWLSIGRDTLVPVED